MLAPAGSNEAKQRFATYVAADSHSVITKKHDPTAAANLVMTKKIYSSGRPNDDRKKISVAADPMMTDDEHNRTAAADLMMTDDCRFGRVSTVLTNLVADVTTNVSASATPHLIFV